MSNMVAHEPWSDAVLRAIADSKGDIDDLVISTEPVYQGYLQLPTKGQDVPQIPSLSKLPPELLLHIFLGMDLQSAMSFEHAGRAAQGILASIPEYRRIRENAAGCIYAIHRTGLARFFTITSLHSTLITKNCIFCKSFGGLIFLPTGARCCFTCIDEGRRPFKVITPFSAERLTELSTDQLKKLYPVLLSIPGIYGRAQMPRKDRVHLVSTAAANIELESIDENGLPIPSFIFGDRAEARCMASVRLPYFDLKTGEVDSGASCRGCQIAMKAMRHEKYFFGRQKLCSREELLEHFHDCEEAKELWASTKNS